MKLSHINVSLLRAYLYKQHFSSGHACVHVCAIAEDAIQALSDACFKADPDGRARVTADFMQRAAAAGKSEEDARAELLGKKSAWWRARTDSTVPPPSELGSRLFSWFMNHCPVIDEPSSVPLFTPKAVHTTMLQIRNALADHFSGMSTLFNSQLHATDAALEKGMSAWPHAVNHVKRTVPMQDTLMAILHPRIA